MTASDVRPEALPEHKRRYIELLLRCEVLRFGSFTTKSGRQSPYFFNMGQIATGRTLGEAADAYAAEIAARFGACDNVFGPAYKGIPLAAMVSERLARRLDRDVSFTFNRKEAKDHGEGGLLVGHAYRGGERVVVVEDVVTRGTSFRETIPLVTARGATIAGLIVGVDREERGEGDDTALAEAGAQFAAPTASIVGLREIVAYLHNRTVLGRVWIDDTTKAAIDAYRAAYGARTR